MHLQGISCLSVFYLRCASLIRVDSAIEACHASADFNVFRYVLPEMCQPDQKLLGSA